MPTSSRCVDRLWRRRNERAKPRRDSWPIDARARHSSRGARLTLSAPRMRSTPTTLDSTSPRRGFRASRLTRSCCSTTTRPSCRSVRRRSSHGGREAGRDNLVHVTTTAESVAAGSGENARGISAGFLPHAAALDENDDVLILSNMELIELSITPTPANHECLAKLNRAQPRQPRTGTPPVSTPTTTPQAAERSTQAPTARKDKTMTEEEVEHAAARRSSP